AGANARGQDLTASNEVQHAAVQRRDKSLGGEPTIIVNDVGGQRFLVSRYELQAGQELLAVLNHERFERSFAAVQGQGAVAVGQAEEMRFLGVSNSLMDLIMG